MERPQPAPPSARVEGDDHVPWRRMPYLVTVHGQREVLIQRGERGQLPLRVVEVRERMQRVRVHRHTCVAHTLATCSGAVLGLGECVQCHRVHS
jgi:hypothetical protein